MRHGLPDLDFGIGAPGCISCLRQSKAGSTEAATAARSGGAELAQRLLFSLLSPP
jgi:hypothetical protein